jgi:hypothetical protein
MKKRKASATSEPGPRLHHINQYLEKNFPDFFAEARFQVGNDDFFLYSRFGFTVLNKMARVSARDPAVRRMMVTGPLEHIVDAPKARALARKRLSTVAQGYLESLCE